jgi:hypothetical protein
MAIRLPALSGLLFRHALLRCQVSLPLGPLDLLPNKATVQKTVIKQTVR